MNNIVPDEIRLNAAHDVLSLKYNNINNLNNIQEFDLPAEFLRVYSPSAEVRGHGKGNEILQTGKINIKIIDLNPTGNYALKITFSDGHDSGLYNWDYLFDLANNYDILWQEYLDKLEIAGASREIDLELLKKSKSCHSSHSCGHH